MSEMDKKEDENIGSFYMGRTRTPPKPKRFLPPGLLTTLALLALAGIVWYAYPRGAEKYTDMDVPVVKADMTPVKAEPVEPGGMDVPHQDSTVFDPLEKKPGEEIEKLLPKPEEPMDKDQALKTAEVPVKMAPKLDLDLQMKDEKNGTEKVVSKGTAEPKPVAVTPPQEEKKKEAEKKPAPAVKKAADGKVYVQLGSFREVVEAKKDWDRLKKKYPGLLDAKVSMKTEKVDLPGKGIYYRLQAGQVTEKRAREICDILKTANPGGCILVK